MKYLVLSFFFILSSIANAQYFSDEFLNADLESSRFQLADWDRVVSEKQEIMMMNSWGIGSISSLSAEDSTCDFVIFPAKYVAKLAFQGIAVSRLEDYKKFKEKEGAEFVITSDFPVLAMIMLPENVVIPDAHSQLFLGLKNSLALEIRFPEEKVIQGKASFMSFKKSIENRIPFFHPFALNSSFSKMNAVELAELHTCTPERVMFDKRTKEGSIKNEQILIYSVPFPKSWAGASYQICAFNTEFGVFHSEPCPRTKEPGKLGEKEFLQLLAALYGNKATSFFPPKP